MQRAVGWRCAFLSLGGRSQNEEVEYKMISKLPKNQKRFLTFLRLFDFCHYLKLVCTLNTSFSDRPFDRGDVYERAEEGCVSFLTK